MTTDVPACLSRLHRGGLVAIPTETVYGLAAHAWNETALEAIFTAKERPKDDPLIIHVDSIETAQQQFWQVTDIEYNILQQLAQTYWPGPLTMVATAQSNVLSIITAQTGMVAVRSPRLLPNMTTLLNIPLAAPSANKFGHVSPTCPQHVMDDLKYEDVWILCPKEEVNEEKDYATATQPCTVGVESTVIQVVHSTVTILRQGQITQEQLEQTLPSTVTVQTKPQQQQQPPAQTDSEPPHVAPGQMIQHYSPNIPSYMIVSTDACVPHPDILRQSVILDMFHHLQEWQTDCLAYCNMGQTPEEIAHNVFASLRWAEQQQPTAKFVFFPQWHVVAKNSILTAVADRLHRAASGRVMENMQDLL